MKSNSKIFKGLKLSTIDSIHLIYINYSRFSTQLDFISNKINKMPLFNNLQENQEILLKKMMIQMYYQLMQEIYLLKVL